MSNDNYKDDVEAFLDFICKENGVTTREELIDIYAKRSWLVFDDFASQFDNVIDFQAYKQNMKKGVDTAV